MIESYNLGKRFGPHWAVKDLNLKVEKGEFFCFLGPNGAGKTTTIKMFAGLIKPTQGKIIIAGKDFSIFDSQIKRIIGYIPDFPFLYENLTCGEFLGFITEIYSLDRDKTRKNIDYYLELFRLKGEEDTLIKEFSHGMKQRLVYVSNLIRQPQVLFIDEPLVGLDPYSIKTIKNILRDFTRKGGTVFMSTHILSIAEELADRVGIIDKGRLLSEGRLQELREFQSERLEDIFFRLTE